MSTKVVQKAIDFDEDATCVAKMARKATRKAARIAEREGFSVKREGNICVARSPEKVIRVTLASTPIDTAKRYTFESHVR